MHAFNSQYVCIAQVNIIGGSAELSRGGLPGTFKLAQFHFHWGTDDSTGSEHTLNGRQYPLEVKECMHQMVQQQKYVTAFTLLVHVVHNFAAEFCSWPLHNQLVTYAPFMLNVYWGTPQIYQMHKKTASSNIP